MRLAGISMTTASLPHSFQDTWTSVLFEHMDSITSWVLKIRKTRCCPTVRKSTIKTSWVGSTIRGSSLLPIPSDLSQSRCTETFRIRYFCGSLNRRKFPGWPCGTSVLNMGSSVVSPACVIVIRNSSRKSTRQPGVINPLPSKLERSNT